MKEKNIKLMDKMMYISEGLHRDGYDYFYNHLRLFNGETYILIKIKDFLNSCFFTGNTLVKFQKIVNYLKQYNINSYVWINDNKSIFNVDSYYILNDNDVNSIKTMLVNYLKSNKLHVFDNDILANKSLKTRLLNAIYNNGSMKK